MNQEEHDALAKMSEEDARKWLEEHYKQKVMNTKEATALFEFESFMSPYAVVKRKLDGKTGTLTFCHSPRFYFDFR